MNFFTLPNSRYSNLQLGQWLLLALKFYRMVFLNKYFSSKLFLITNNTDTLSFRVILNLVISGSVMLNLPFFDWLIKKGMTEPLDPITLPYRTTENDKFLTPA